MRIFLFLLLSGFSSLTFAQKMLILGDSLSAAYGMQQQQGWVHLLQQQLDNTAQPWQLINASISGETTGGGLARLPVLLQRYQPDAVLIELGGNDGLRGFDVATIQDNLSQIIQLVKQHNASAILMQIRIPPNYGPRYGRQFSELFPVLAKQHQITLWPFFMDNIATEPSLMLPDGIHPNEQAQPIIQQFMMELFEDLAVSGD